MVTLEIEVGNSPAVGGNQTTEAPLVSQSLSLIPAAASPRLAVDALIGTHHLGNMSFLNKGFEGRKICLPKVARW